MFICLKIQQITATTQRWSYFLACRCPGLVPGRAGQCQPNITRNLGGYLFVTVIMDEKVKKEAEGLDVLTTNHPYSFTVVCSQVVNPTPQWTAEPMD